MALSVGSVLTLCGVLAPQVHANSLTQKKTQLHSLQSKASEATHQLYLDKQKQQKLQNQIQSNHNIIQNQSQSIAANVVEMNKLQSQMEQLDQRIAATKQQLAAQQQQVEQWVRSDYENGNVALLEVLFKATSFQDFMARLTLLSEVTRAQTQLAKHVQKLQVQLVNERQQQKTTFNSLQYQTHKLQASLSSHQQTNNQTKSNLNLVSRDVSLQAAIEAQLQDRIHYTKNQIKEIQAQTAKDEAKMKNKSYVASARTNLQNVDVTALVAYAKRFIGLPYHYGGQSPSTGFDCSGYTQYVFNHAGIHLPRTSEAQFGVGVPVSRQNLQPGDLVFYATVTNGASHVGIYIGNGQMINSEGLGLRITNAFSPYYWGPRYLGARDVIRHSS